MNSFVYFLVCFPVELQQTSPSPVCPGDDVIFTCKVTVSTNQSEMLVLVFFDAFDKNNIIFYDAETMISSNSSTIGPFTTKIVETSNGSIVATATIKGITYEDVPCAGISCNDFFGSRSVLYVALGKKKGR